MKSDVNLRVWKPDDSWQRAAAETLTDWGYWDVMATLLKETAKAHKRLETKEITITEVELESLLLKKKGEGRHFERAELNWFCRAIWRQRRALKREKHLDKIKESAETGRAPKKTQSKHFNWKSIAKQENSETVLPNFFQDLYSIPVDQEDVTQSERLHWIELWWTVQEEC